MTAGSRLWLLAGLVILIVAGFLAGLAWLSRPKLVKLQPPVDAEVKSVIKRMHLLEGDIVCLPATRVDVLADVMVDSGDYRPSASESKMIERFFGKQALDHAGLLTAEQAYYLSMRTPAAATPPPGLKPTALPTHYCPADREKKLDQEISYSSLLLGTDNKAIVRYTYGGGEYEAMLRLINGGWLVTSIRILRPPSG